MGKYSPLPFHFFDCFTLFAYLDELNLDSAINQEIFRRKVETISLGFKRRMDCRYFYLLVFRDVLICLMKPGTGVFAIKPLYIESA